MERSEKQVDITRISSKGQVVIPKKVREKLNWDTGEHVIIEYDDSAVLMRKMNLEEILKEAEDDYSKGKAVRLRSKKNG